MNKWLAVVVLALSVLTSAMGLKAVTGGSLVAAQGPMPRRISNLTMVYQGPMPRR